MDREVHTYADVLLERDNAEPLELKAIPNAVDLSFVPAMITDAAANSNLTFNRDKLVAAVSHMIDRPSPARRLANNKWRLGWFQYNHGMYNQQTGTAPLPSLGSAAQWSFSVFNSLYRRTHSAIFQPLPTVSLAFPVCRLVSAYQGSNRTTDQMARAYTYVDVPGSNIGMVFLHPVGRQALFSEASIIPTSQGAVTVTGQFEVPTKDLGNMAYLTNFHDAGGTGDQVSTGTGAVLTNPATINVSPATPFTPAMVSSGNHYVALSNPTNTINRGVFKITGYVDASTVTVDAVAINQPLTTETTAGLSWSLRTGPIGTYWMRKMGYRFGGYAYNHDATYYASLDQLHGFGRWNPDLYLVNPGAGFQVNGAPLSCFQSERDQQGRWWMAFRVAAGGPGTALRTYWHNSSETFRSPYVEQTGQFRSGGTADPGAAALCVGVAIDQNGYVWTAWRNGTLSLVVINPVTDTVVATYTAQSYANTVGASSQPLSLNVRRVLFDNLRNRLYVFHDEGMSYTDDGGTTWSRHRINTAGTGTIDVTGTAVVGTGTTFSTQVAAGDWIKIGGDTNFHRVASVASNTSLTLTTTHANISAQAFTVGMLSSNVLVCGAQTGNASTDTFAPVNASLHMLGVSPCDFGDDGYLYWVGRDHNGVHRWSGNDVSVPQTVAASHVPLNGSVAAGNTQANQFHFVCYNRATPGDAATGGGGTRLFKSKLFITGGSNANSDLGNNWIGICMIDPAAYAWAGGALVYGTDLWRWHPTFVDSWVGGTLDVPATTFESRATMLIDRATGHMNAMVTFNAGSTGLFWFSQHPTNSPGILTQDSTGSQNSGNAYSTNMLRNADFALRFEADPFDSLFRFFGHTDQGSVVTTDNAAELVTQFHMWRDFRWNGTAWVTGYGASQAYSATGQNARFVNPVVGAGLRRMHVWNEPIGEGLVINFTDAVAVAQASQFIAEESATVTACYGVLKGHQDRVTVNVHTTLASTFMRVNAETKKTAVKAQATLGGFTPMFRQSATLDTTDTLAMFKDGPGDNRARILSGENSRPPNYAISITNTIAHAQYGLEINLTHEVEFQDGVTGAGTNIFSSAGYVFQAGDVGKTIIIYQSAQGNNGPAVITGASGGPFPSNAVTVNKTFAATSETARAWKLKNIDSVAFVQFGNSHYGTNNATAQHYRGFLANTDYKLYKSFDGASWSLVKQYMGPVSTTPTDASSPLTYGTTVPLSWDTNWGPVGGDGGPTGEPSDRSQTTLITFDLSDIPANDTRAPFWKVVMRMNTNVGFGPNSHQPLGYLAMKNRSGVPMTYPTGTLMDDGADPTMLCLHPLLALMHRDAGTATAVTTAEDGDLNPNRTNRVTITGKNFYLQQGLNGVGNGTTTFTSATAAFTVQHQGLKIRIHDAGNSANNGFATILSVNSATSVVLSKSLVTETSLAWELLNIGSGDLLRFILPVLDGLSSLADADTYFTISDVPTQGQVLLTTGTAPQGLNGVDWDIATNIGATTAYQSNTAGTALEYGPVSGRVDWPENLIYATLASGSTGTGTTFADTDGDGTADTFRLTSTGVNLATQAQTGDILVVTKAGNGFGTRYMPIVATPTVFAANQYDVKTAYDEYPLSTAIDSWSVLRPLTREYRLARYVAIVTDLP